MANEIFPYIIPLRQLVHGVRFMLSVHYEPELQCCLITRESLRHPPTHFIPNVDRIKPAAEITGASAAAEQCALSFHDQLTPIFPKKALKQRLWVGDP